MTIHDRIFLSSPLLSLLSFSHPAYVIIDFATRFLLTFILVILLFPTVDLKLTWRECVPIHRKTCDNHTLAPTQQTEQMEKEEKYSMSPWDKERREDVAECDYYTTLSNRSSSPVAIPIMPNTGHLVSMILLLFPLFSFFLPFKVLKAVSDKIGEWKENHVRKITTETQRERGRRSVIIVWPNHQNDYILRELDVLPFFSLGGRDKESNEKREQLRETRETDQGPSSVDFGLWDLFLQKATGKIHCRWW